MFPAPHALRAAVSLFGCTQRSFCDNVHHSSALWFVSGRSTVGHGNRLSAAWGNAAELGDERPVLLHPQHALFQALIPRQPSSRSRMLPCVLGDTIPTRRRELYPRARTPGALCTLRTLYTHGVEARRTRRGTEAPGKGGSVRLWRERACSRRTSPGTPGVARSRRFRRTRSTCRVRAGSVRNPQGSSSEASGFIVSSVVL